jgi:hypothetical protein
MIGWGIRRKTGTCRIESRASAKRDLSPALQCFHHTPNPLYLLDLRTFIPRVNGILSVSFGRPRLMSQRATVADHLSLNRQLAHIPSLPFRFLFLPFISLSLALLFLHTKVLCIECVRFSRPSASSLPSNSTSSLVLLVTSTSLTLGSAHRNACDHRKTCRFLALGGSGTHGSPSRTVFPFHSFMLYVLFTPTQII